MSVPDNDTVCRFVRSRDWNKRDNRPKTGAFKQAGLSVWHQERLRERGVSLRDLQIEHLAGSGQAHHKAGDYRRFADEAAQTAGVPFQVQVEWRPGDEYVAEHWRQWRYAHIQVEATEGPSDFPLEFRRLLAVNARPVVPPL